MNMDEGFNNITPPLRSQVDHGSSSTSMNKKKRKSSEIERSSNNNTNIAPNVYDILQARSSLDGYTSLARVYHSHHCPCGIQFNNINKLSYNHTNSGICLRLAEYFYAHGITTGTKYIGFNIPKKKCKEEYNSWKKIQAVGDVRRRQQLERRFLANDYYAKVKKILSCRFNNIETVGTTAKYNLCAHHFHEKIWNEIVKQTNSVGNNHIALKDAAAVVIPLSLIKAEDITEMSDHYHSPKGGYYALPTMSKIEIFDKVLTLHYGNQIGSVVLNKKFRKVTPKVDNKHENDGIPPKHTGKIYVQTIRDLERQLSEMRAEMERLKRENKTFKNTLETPNLDVFSGICRRSLFSSSYHKKNPDFIKFFGVGSCPSYESLLWFTNCTLGVLLEDGVLDVSLDNDKYGSTTTPLPPITETEKALACLLYMRKFPTTLDIAAIFNVHHQRVSEWIRKYIPLWGKVGKLLSTIPINAEYLDSVCPPVYKATGWEHAAFLLDGKDTLIDTPRLNSCLKVCCWSNKMKASAIRYLSWSAHRGLSFAHTRVYLARVVEQKLCELYGPFMTMLVIGRGILVDKGFDGIKRYNYNLNDTFSPHFLRGIKQFSTGALAYDEIIKKLRYTCEVFFSRVITLNILKDRMAFHHLKYANDLVNWGHAVGNLGGALCGEKITWADIGVDKEIHQ